jgi:aryl-alcohol dehydrogenase-like predicted oxidoreductase
MQLKNRVGLGTFPLASVFSKISKDKAKEIVKLFLDNGGYYIDTAPLYGFGEVESLLGEVLPKYPRDKYFIFTKCGYVDVEGKTFQTVQKSGKYDDVVKECERSLKRLGLDYVDLYFVHSPDPNTSFDETMKALIKLQEQGKIKEIGVSNVNLAELKEYNKNANVKYVQNRFSLINRSIDKDLERYLLEKKIGLIPYQVIDRGQLTGKVFEGVGNLITGDLRIGRSDWLPDKINVIADWVKENLSPIAKRFNITLGQLSVAWALHQKYLSFVIVGTTNPEYIPINLKANNIVLSPAVLKEIDEAYYKLEKEVKVKFHQTIREFRGLNEKYY